MSKRFISIGIDHGTTNSCIAVMDGDRPRVVRSFTGEDVMPSAVYIDKRGRRFIGQAALNAMRTRMRPEDGDGFSRYKLSIGQDRRYEFKASQQVMTAPELGAVVIGELLRCYREEMGEQPKAAVITVPAKFEHSACDGTRTAARLAGLVEYPQIQEPIAAALAYGFTSKDERAHWMVFDLGGGTLDVSLVRVRGGQLTIPEEGHGGDPHLGGSKFDRELLAWVVGELQKRYALSSFTEQNPTYTNSWSSLHLACEEAKIQLSDKKEAIIEVVGVLCKDEQGKPVKVEVPIERAQYEKMIEADVERAVHSCQVLLEKNHLTPKDVDRLILVGGPTKTPYVRQALAERLGIELDASIDPMTAVAIGAALHAATVEIGDQAAERVVVPVSDPNGVALKLQYESKSDIPTHCVIGHVEGPAVAQGGLTFEIRRSDGLWSSMPQPIDEAGDFSFDVLLIDEGKPKQSSFTTVIKDRSGRVLASLDEPQIWYPFPGAAPRLANSLLIALKDNATDKLLPHGAELPVRKSGHYETTKLIRKGSREDILRIPVLEGINDLLGEENSQADCNFHIGTLKILGSDERVTHDLPEGAELEVELYQDESRKISVRAYVPLLDADFEATLSSEPLAWDLKAVQWRFEDLKEELDRAEKLEVLRPNLEVAKALEVIDRLQVVAGLEKELERAQQGEPEARHRAFRRILELAGAIHRIRGWQQKARIEKRLEDLTGVAGPSETKDLESIRKQFQDAGGDSKKLGEVEQALDDMDRHLRRKPYFDLLIDLWALGGLRVSPYQHELFNRADALIKKIDAKGGKEVLTEADIAELIALHEKLVQAHSDLFTRREKVLAELPQGASDADLADIVKARSGR
ncbi:MAG TPA: Hsp70 family protein [Thermoanaerobaculia bacterium]|nr:Hsp70 family protein [Thermoanaerobaculia bacterium]